MLSALIYVSLHLITTYSESARTQKNPIVPVPQILTLCFSNLSGHAIHGQLNFAILWWFYSSMDKYRASMCLLLVKWLKFVIENICLGLSARRVSLFHRFLITSAWFLTNPWFNFIYSWYATLWPSWQSTPSQGVPLPPEDSALHLLPLGGIAFLQDRGFMIIIGW